MCIDFWTDKLNPITLLPNEVIVNRELKEIADAKKEKKPKKEVIDLSNDEDYISFKEINKRYDCNLSFIKDIISKYGFEYKRIYSLGTQYFKRKDIEKCFSKIKAVDRNRVPDTYISSAEIKEKLKWCKVKLSRIAKEKGWKGEYFGTKTIHYLKTDIKKNEKKN